MLKTDQWKRDRNRLRKELREGNHKGDMATFLCVLVAHMRGKIHMSAYRKYSGGWNNKGRSVPLVAKDINKYSRAYGTASARYSRACVIADCVDQDDWIKWFLQVNAYLDLSDYEKLVDRVRFPEEKVLPMGVLHVPELAVSIAD
ncbi:MAG: hypothetical protein KAJ19_13415 [Gammaproteobacteria bacterium]|nr:hypothetical protein [Gammaproteobacteria bacterium]